MKRWVSFLFVFFVGCCLSAQPREKERLVGEWRIASFDSGETVCTLDFVTSAKVTDGCRTFLLLEGLNHPGRICINGCFVGRGGELASDCIDVTPLMNLGGENTLSVSGNQVYWNSYLLHTPSVFFSYHGVKMLQRMEGSFCKISVSPTVSNRGLNEKTVMVSYELRNDEGYIVARIGKGKPFSVPSFGDVVLEGNLAVKYPHLWTPEDPYLYSLHTLLYDEEGNLLVDHVTKTGLRNTDVEENAEIATVNSYFIGIGSALSEEFWRFWLGCIKDFGYKIITFSGLDTPEIVLDICDEIGLMVIEKFDGLPGISDERIAPLKAMIIRDMNHPCVVRWELCAEEDDFRDSSTKSKLFSEMSNFVHAIDSSRICDFDLKKREFSIMLLEL